MITRRTLARRAALAAAFAAAGVAAPAGTPQPVLEKLNAALVQALAQPEVRTQLAELGAPAAQPMSTERFWTFVKQQMPEAAELVRASGAKVE